MKPTERGPDWRIGWIAAAIALAAALILAVDLAQNQNALTEPDVQTQQAATQAGAFVTPTDPSQYP